MEVFETGQDNINYGFPFHFVSVREKYKMTNVHGNQNKVLICSNSVVVSLLLIHGQLCLPFASDFHQKECSEDQLSLVTSKEDAHGRTI